MANSLQDQLLKSGLVDNKKAKQTAKTKRKQTNAERKGKAPVAQKSDLASQRARQIERDRELNRKKQQQAEQRAKDAQIRQLIESNRLQQTDGEIGFNFVWSGKIKRVHVNPDTHRRLSNGSLSIALLDGRYELLPKEAAVKIQERAPERVVLLENVAEKAAPDEDDPYAGFEVPDDLMW